MISGKEAEDILSAIKALDPISDNVAISVVEGELMGLAVNIICAVERTPHPDGTAYAFSPVAVIADPSIAARLRIAGHETEQKPGRNRIGFQMPTARA